MAGLRPQLVCTRLPQPAREAQLLQEALTSQCTCATPLCRNHGSPLFNHCTALNLILSEIRFAVCGGSSPTTVISALSRTVVLTVRRPVRNSWSLLAAVARLILIEKLNKPSE